MAHSIVDTPVGLLNKQGYWVGYFDNMHQLSAHLKVSLAEVYIAAKQGGLIGGYAIKCAPRRVASIVTKYKRKQLERRVYGGAFLLGVATMLVVHAICTLKGGL